jgi:hypothetical protein
MSFGRILRAGVELEICLLGATSLALLNSDLQQGLRPCRLSCAKKQKLADLCVLESFWERGMSRAG